MLDKTKLEEEIEDHEDTTVPRWIRILIILLVIIIFSLGLHSFNLIRDISRKDNELMMMKEDYLREKNEMLRRIKRLENSVQMMSPDSSGTE